MVGKSHKFDSIPYTIQCNIKNYHVIESISLSLCWSDAGLGRRESFDLNQFHFQGFQASLKLFGGHLSPGSSAAV